MFVGDADNDDLVPQPLVPLISLEPERELGVELQPTDASELVDYEDREYLPSPELDITEGGTPGWICYESYCPPSLRA